MATYTYKCDDCDIVVTVTQPMTTTRVITCAKCTSAMRKVITTPVAVIFKGDGFYSNDNRNDS